jgi:alpha,alpha-trehalose-phosphate synthase [UDP-forming]
MWTSEQLKELVARNLREFRLICVSNREPYSHEFSPEGIRCQEPVSGVVSALDPVMQATDGTWVAHGSGAADREVSGEEGRIRVPPDADRYTLRRMWLTPDDVKGYYNGFANAAMWPLCHVAYERPVFERSDWDRYVDVNRRFADAVVEEAGDDRALVFVHDYHFSLLPKLVKKQLPGAIVFQFWHIPWPNAEIFRICPWGKEILEGLLGNDLLSFHIQYHCNNFLDTIDRELEARVDRDQFCVTYGGSPTLVRPQAIGVDFERIAEMAARPATLERMETLRKQWRLDGHKVILGVDRLDYTKGILERLQAVERLLDHHQEYLGKLVFLEIGVPTRGTVASYRTFEKEVEALVERINTRFQTAAWRPIEFVKEHQNRPELLAYYRVADICTVTSIHDGMNLVAKEFVAARVDERGALLLSPFTGAAKELTQAIIQNPYAVDDLADRLREALEMGPEEQQARMRRMRETVREQNVYKWVGKLLHLAARLEPS